MFFDDVAAMDEAALERVIKNQVAEGLTLEFKAKLDLTGKQEKREAAKDVSAMANTAGGQILYGIAEKAVADGTKVAAGVTALTDGTVETQLADVLASAVHPRVYPTMRRVPIATGGFVLIVEVRRSYADLHMVIGYDTFRFYKRDTKGTVPMTEPEVRQEYERIAAAKTSLDARLGQAIAAEASVRSKIDESVIVVPWYSSPTFLDPRIVEPFGSRLRDDALAGLNDGHSYAELRLVADGYRMTSLNKPAATAALYIAVLKTGVMHISYHNALHWTSDKEDLMKFDSAPALMRIVVMLMVARYVCRLVKHWAPVRLAYFLRPTKPFLIDPTMWDITGPIQPFEFRATPVDVRFDEAKSIGRATKEILDQVFQIASRLECPYFDRNGVLVEKYRKNVFPDRIVQELV